MRLIRFLSPMIFVSIILLIFIDYNVFFQVAFFTSIGMAYTLLAANFSLSSFDKRMKRMVKFEVGGHKIQILNLDKFFVAVFFSYWLSLNKIEFSSNSIYSGCLLIILYLILLCRVKIERPI